MNLSVHTGTHMDAPLHFLADGKDITALPFDKVIGPARIIEIKEKKSIKTAELEKANIQKGQCILFKTVNSSMQWDRWNFSRILFTCQQKQQIIWQKNKLAA